MTLLFSLIAGSIVSLVDYTPSCDSVEKGNYNVSNCWNCFQKLLNDCDRTRSEGTNNDERRRACYQAANNFFTYCLGKVPTAPRNAPISVLPTQQLIIGEGMALQVNFGSKVTSDQVTVFVRHGLDGEIKQEKATSFVFPNADGTCDVLIDDASLDLSGESSVGIVVALTDAQGTVTNAFATVVEVENKLDLNRDGLVDNSDTIELWNKYAANEISYEEFVKLSSQIK